MPLRGEGMRKLPNIELTREEFKETYNRLDRRYHGSEACIAFNIRPGVCRKVFLNTFQIERKIPKLYWLYENEEKLDNDVKILSTVRYKNKFFSYDMTYDEDDALFNRARLSKEKTIEYLQLSREKLERIHSLGAVYGDVKADNILINRRTGNLSFCDLDNIQIGNRYPIDTLSDYLEFFSNDEGFVRENADYYMHSLMTLSMLDGEHCEYYEILQMLDLGRSFNFLEPSANPTLQKMNDALFDYKGDYLIDYVKKR